MRRTHELSLFRRSASAGRTKAGRQVKDLGEPLATRVPCNFQAGEGRLRTEHEGRRVELAGRLFVHPTVWPAGVQPERNDVVVVTSGPADPDRYRVHDVRPLGGGAWDDELALTHALEPIR